MAASYTEDKFGVVQKDLSAILTLLLNLQSVGRGKVIDGRFGPKFEQCFVIDWVHTVIIPLGRKTPLSPRWSQLGKPHELILMYRRNGPHLLRCRLWRFAWPLAAWCRSERKRWWTRPQMSSWSTGSSGRSNRPCTASSSDFSATSRTSTHIVARKRSRRLAQPLVWVKPTRLLVSPDTFGRRQICVHPRSNSKSNRFFF